jgi:hypothetical protein
MVTSQYGRWTLTSSVGASYDGRWVKHDYGKPGLPASVEGAIWNTSLVGLHVKSGESGTCSFVLQVQFSRDHHVMLTSPAPNADPIPTLTAP